MLKKNLHNKFHLIVYWGCAISVLIVLIVGAVSLHYVNQQEKMDQWMDRNYKVIASINLMQYRLNEIGRTKNSLAGVSINRDSNLNSSKNGLLSQFNVLSDILSTDSGQKRRVILLKDRIDRLFTMWQSDNFAGRPSEANIYRQTIRQDEMMEQVRKVINDINYAEQQLLLKKRTENRLLTDQIKWVTISATILMLAVVISLVALIINELKYRKYALEREQETSKLKSNFVSLASHEFRTPLSSVSLSVNLIRRYLEKNDSQNITKHCDKIEGSVKNLITILEDFLSLEKLETGKVQATYRPFDLRALSEEIVNDMRIIAKPAQSLSYQHSGSDGLVFLDEHLIKNSLINLVSNAIKYAGDNAEIIVRTENRSGKVTITVSDNGAGISEKDQRSLFQPFFRANNNASIPGTGLGLNIVMRYVKLMKGSVTVSSVPNKETSFTLSFQHP
ncbi:MAG TPA: HAMP domain-containing sensor histidine kinase [Mucilaginibacter sp.]|nr:HAMP domain-containing sensor histidine kinase [Mucilaginibacter sp.]